MGKLDLDFSSEERARYSRHFLIPEFGEESQVKLKGARVLVVGAGGLGSPALLYLAAAGVGYIGIVDFDRVEDSNLQRQVLFTTSDIGQGKAEKARDRLLQLNPLIHVEIHTDRLDSTNARELIRQYDVVADGTDNFPTRYLVNDACVLEGKVNVYASVFQFEGQVSVFNYGFSDGSRGPNYRDMFPEPPPPGSVPSCAEGGVLGVLPGIIGSMQALEIIKVITGVGEPLVGRMFLFDAVSFQTRIIKVPSRAESRIEGLIDYELFCGSSSVAIGVPGIGARELQGLLASNEPIQLIDVREPHEHAQASIGGNLIPLGTVDANSHRVLRDRKVVVYCRSGRRSAQAVRQWIQQLDAENLFSLEGGLLSWRDEVDPQFPVY